MVKCRLFIDEVGNDDLKVTTADENQRYLSLTGLVTRLDVHHARFVPGVADFKARHLTGAVDRVILHRREILRHEGPFAVLRDPQRRTAFDADLLRLIDGLPFIATTVVLDKMEHLELYGSWLVHPYLYCLTVLIERYVLWLVRHGYVGDVAIEPRNKKPDRIVKAAYARIHDTGTQHLPPDLMQRHLTSREIKFIAKSDDDPAMQVVDLIAHPSYRHMKFERSGVPPPRDFGARITEILEASKYARNPRTLVVAGWGKKWLP